MISDVITLFFDGNSSAVYTIKSTKTLTCSFGR